MPRPQLPGGGAAGGDDMIVDGTINMQQAGPAVGSSTAGAGGAGTDTPLGLR